MSGKRQEARSCCSHYNEVTTTTTTTLKTKTNWRKVIKGKRKRPRQGSSNILEEVRIQRRRCTMICATFLLCYLFTCCAITTHLSSVVSALDSAQLAPDALAPTSAANQRQHIENIVANTKRNSYEQAKTNGISAGSGSAASAHDDNDDDELKHDNVHRLMSEQDLRRTFQVDSHDQVPEYEILKLTVNDDGSHLISPISDLGELTTTTHTKYINYDHHHQQQLQHKPKSTNEQDANLLQSSRTKTTQTSQEASSSSQQQQQQQSRHKRSPSVDSSASGAAGEAVRDSTKDAKVLGAETRSQQEQKQKRQASDYANDKSYSNDYDHQDEDKLIVMKLSTFGKDFKLRLKRNVDFQQRIKDMKMFMAESTGDGQLRYTEIKSQQQQQQQHQHHQRKQEPHKREANGDDNESVAAQSAAANIEPSSNNKSTATKTSDDGNSRPTKRSSAVGSDIGGSPANVWNIGSTYHDEDNLAALLIDHDRRTGQLQVDGTIGNDFVIKPMPQATIDALVVKRQQQQQQQQQHVAGDEDNSAAAATNNGSTVARATHQQPGAGQKKSVSVATKQQVATSGRQQLERAIHMHDDDPHDDDEMFLDEDEAIELAQIQQSAASIESNHTSAPTVAVSQVSNLTAASQTAGRPLSKAATERKWRKYRKLMAQTQVPKPGSFSNQRARRHVAPGEAEDQRKIDNEAQATGRQVQVSHHIVYRQKPSAEGSSSEHQHSFMISPSGQQVTIDQLAATFGQRNSQRLHKRESDAGLHQVDAGGNMIEMPRVAADEDQLIDADFLHDPLGGQFYLEPGSVTGVERAGYSDWSLIGGSRRMAPPPYALNSTGAFNGTHNAAGNSTSQHGARFRRHARLPPPPPPPGVNQRRKRQAPDTVWPEVLLVVDYDSFLLHGGDSRDVKRYFVSFWNGVDLRYKLLVHPHIRISLAGMIVAKDRDATPYLERNRLRAPNADAVDAAGALTDMGKYLYREDRLPTYDLAVVITKLDMCRRRYEGGRCNRGTAGFAYVGGACVVNKRLEKVNSVAIIEDSGGFSGIIVAAHEVGHLLGCVHDGSPPPSYLGGPGATHCPWEDGFIMSDLRHTERGFRWSQCSVEQFKHFLNGETATCLYNYPHESQMLHRLLPGTMLTLDEQCKRDRGTNACFKDARVCAQLFCFDSASGYCVSYRPAAEGSPCGEGQVCRNGKCVGEIENIIPDYTHQSQTVVARGRNSHGSVGRLADNGLSASSTSTATASPPDAPGKLANNAKAVSVPQITSRMDTYPIDTPTSYSPASYPFGGRYSHTGGHAKASGGLSMSAATTVPQSMMTTMKSAKLIADHHVDNGNTGRSTGAIKPQPAQYMKRSGHQALPKQPSTTGANNNSNRQQQQQVSSYHHNGNSKHSSTTAALHTSAASTSIAHLYPKSGSVNGGNNLLTSASTIPATVTITGLGSHHNVKNNHKGVVAQHNLQQQQQQQQPLYDSQRIMYNQQQQQQQQQLHTPTISNNANQYHKYLHGTSQQTSNVNINHNNNNNINNVNYHFQQQPYSSNGQALARAVTEDR